MATKKATATTKASAKATKAVTATPSTTNTLTDRQKAFSDLQDCLTRLYKVAGVAIKPKYPFVLVRVLPRIQQLGSIILPENQKKTTIEGIVLDVFAPFWRNSRGGGPGKQVLIESSCTPGDHVIFPHYEGVPVPVDEYTGDFRLVPEIFMHYGAERNGIIGTIEYTEQKTSEWLTILLTAHFNGASEKGSFRVEELVSHLMQNAEVFPHNRVSLTQSAIREARETPNAD